MAEDIANFDIQSTLQVGVEGTERVGANVQENMEAPLNRAITAANGVERAVKRIGSSSAQLDLSARINRSQQAFVRTLQTTRSLDTALKNTNRTLQQQTIEFQRASGAANGYLSRARQAASSMLIGPRGVLTAPNIDTRAAAGQSFMSSVQKSMAMRLIGLWAVMRNVNTVLDTVSTMDMMNASMIRVTGSTRQSADAMRYAMQVGMEYGATVQDVAAVMVELGRTGMDMSSVKYLTANIAEVRYLLASSTGVLMDMQEVGGHATAIMQQLNVSATETVRIMRMMAELDTASATSFDKLGQALTRFAASGRAAGLSIEEMLKSATILTERGFTGETAGTALNTIVMRIDRSPEARAYQQDLGIERVERLADGTLKVNSAMDRLYMMYVKLKKEGKYLELMDMANLYAGTRQAAKLFALLDGMQTRSAEIDKIMQDAQSTDGVVQQRRTDALQAMRDTIVARRAQMHNMMVNDFVQPFFADFAKSFISESAEILQLISGVTVGITQAFAKIFSFGGLLNFGRSDAETSLDFLNGVFKAYLLYRIPRTIYQGMDAITSSLYTNITNMGKGIDVRRGISLFDDMERGITGQVTILRQATNEVASAHVGFTNAVNKMYADYQASAAQFTYQAFDPKFNKAFSTMPQNAPLVDTFKRFNIEEMELSKELFAIAPLDGFTENAKAAATYNNLLATRTKLEQELYSITKGDTPATLLKSGTIDPTAAVRILDISRAINVIDADISDVVPKFEAWSNTLQKLGNKNIIRMDDILKTGQFSELGAQQVREIRAKITDGFKDMQRVTGNLLGDSFEMPNLQPLGKEMQETVTKAMQEAFNNTRGLANRNFANLPALEARAQKELDTRMKQYTQTVQAMNAPGAQINFDDIHRQWTGIETVMKRLSTLQGGGANALGAAMNVITEQQVTMIQQRVDRINKMINAPNTYGPLKVQLMDIRQVQLNSLNEITSATQKLQELENKPGGRINQRARQEAIKDLVRKMKQVEQQSETVDGTLNNIEKSSQSAFGRWATNLANVLYYVNLITAAVGFLITAINLATAAWDKYKNRHSQTARFIDEYQAQQQMSTDLEKKSADLNQALTANQTELENTALEAVNAIVLASFSKVKKNGAPITAQEEQYLQGFSSPAAVELQKNFLGRLMHTYQLAAHSGGANTPLVQDYLNSLTGLDADQRKAIESATREMIANDWAGLSEEMGRELMKAYAGIGEAPLQQLMEDFPQLEEPINRFISALTGIPEPLAQVAKEVGNLNKQLIENARRTANFEDSTGSDFLRAMQDTPLAQWAQNDNTARLLQDKLDSAAAIGQQMQDNATIDAGAVTRALETILDNIGTGAINRVYSLRTGYAPAAMTAEQDELSAALSPFAGNESMMANFESLMRGAIENPEMTRTVIEQMLNTNSSQWHTTFTSLSDVVSAMHSGLDSTIRQKIDQLMMVVGGLAPGTFVLGDSAQKMLFSGAGLLSNARTAVGSMLGEGWQAAKTAVLGAMGIVQKEDERQKALANMVPQGVPTIERGAPRDLAREQREREIDTIRRESEENNRDLSVANKAIAEDTVRRIKAENATLDATMKAMVTNADGSTKFLTGKDKETYDDLMKEWNANQTQLATLNNMLFPRGRNAREREASKDILAAIKDLHTTQKEHLKVAYKGVYEEGELVDITDRTDTTEYYDAMIAETLRYIDELRTVNGLSAKATPAEVMRFDAKLGKELAQAFDNLMNLQRERVQSRIEARTRNIEAKIDTLQDQQEWMMSSRGFAQTQQNLMDKFALEMAQAISSSEAFPKEQQGAMSALFTNISNMLRAAYGTDASAANMTSVYQQLTMMLNREIERLTSDENAGTKGTEPMVNALERLRDTFRESANVNLEQDRATRELQVRMYIDEQDRQLLRSTFAFLQSRDIAATGHDPTMIAATSARDSFWNQLMPTVGALQDQYARDKNFDSVLSELNRIFDSSAVYLEMIAENTDNIRGAESKGTLPPSLNDILRASYDAQETLKPRADSLMAEMVAALESAGFQLDEKQRLQIYQIAYQREKELSEAQLAGMRQANEEFKQDMRSWWDMGMEAGLEGFGADSWEKFKKNVIRRVIQQLNDNLFPPIHEAITTALGRVFGKLNLQKNVEAVVNAPGKVLPNQLWTLDPIYHDNIRENTANGMVRQAVPNFTSWTQSTQSLQQSIDRMGSYMQSRYTPAEAIPNYEAIWSTIPQRTIANVFGVPAVSGGTQQPTGMMDYSPNESLLNKLSSLTIAESMDPLFALQDDVLTYFGTLTEVPKHINSELEKFNIGSVVDDIKFEDMVNGSGGGGGGLLSNVGGVLMKGLGSIISGFFMGAISYWLNGIMSGWLDEQTNQIAESQRAAQRDRITTSGYNWSYRDSESASTPYAEYAAPITNESMKTIQFNFTTNVTTDAAQAMIANRRELERVIAEITNAQYRIMSKTVGNLV